MDCDVIKDLMPLYVEDLTSEASINIIEEHVKSCRACKETLIKMQSDIINANTRPKVDEIENTSKTLIKRIRKNIYEKVLITVSITLVLGIVIGIYSTKILMFMAFLGSISITAFATAIFVSIPICRRKYSLRKQFKVLGNWVFAFSIVFSCLLFLLFREFFNESAEIMIILILEILYGIVFSLTLRVYARFKLPKDDILGDKNRANKKLFTVAVTTLSFITILVAVPLTILERNKTVDNINLSFVNDNEVIGKWTTVDFVSSPERFNAEKQPSTDKVFLKEMTFLENGQMKVKYNNVEDQQYSDIPRPWLSWTRDYVMNKGGDYTLSKYEIREINGDIHMFFEWKTGDYSYFHKKPNYYVLKKEVKE